MAWRWRGLSGRPARPGWVRRSLFTLEALASEFDETLRPRLIERIDAFRALIEGPDSIPEARQNSLRSSPRPRDF